MCVCVAIFCLLLSVPWTVLVLAMIQWISTVHSFVQSYGERRIGYEHLTLSRVSNTGAVILVYAALVTYMP